MAEPETLAITLDAGEAGPVSGLVDSPAEPAGAFVLAHGAGAGMAHPFMAAAARGLAARGIAVLRFNFAYMERGSKRPDPPRLAHAAVRAAADEAARRWPGVPLAAGGKSFGGRMTSQAQAAAPLAGIGRLGFIGFPLHPAGKPGIERAAHLADVALPMLFLQGTRDDLADLGLLSGVIESLGARATLHVIRDADHAFHVRASSGRNDAAAMAELLDALADWITNSEHSHLRPAASPTELDGV